MKAVLLLKSHRVFGVNLTDSVEDSSLEAYESDKI